MPTLDSSAPIAPIAADVVAPAPAAPAARPAKDPVPRQLSDAALVAHIVEHQRAVERTLQYLVPLLGKIASFHARRNGKLDALREAGQALSEALDAHLEAEQREVFPALAEAPAGEALRRDVQRLHRDHRRLVVLLARMRSLADGYVVPEWGGRSYWLLMQELRDLEDEVKEHIHLESYALVPRLLSRAPGAA